MASPNQFRRKFEALDASYQRASARGAHACVKDAGDSTAVADATHPALLRAQEIFDLPGDLNPDQAQFLNDVHRIGWDKVRDYQTAQRVWGDAPKMLLACQITADKHCSDDLALALDRYEQSIEAQDELLDIAFAMAEA
jgi:hypothetical protein